MEPAQKKRRTRSSVCRYVDGVPKGFSEGDVQVFEESVYQVLVSGLQEIAWYPMDRGCEAQREVRFLEFPYWYSARLVPYSKKWVKIDVYDLVGPNVLVYEGDGGWQVQSSDMDLTNLVRGEYVRALTESSVGKDVARLIGDYASFYQGYLGRYFCH